MRLALKMTLAAAFGLMVIETAAARTIRVPADIGTIQAAVDDARPNDTIAIANGVWSGQGNTSIRVRTANLTIMSMFGPWDCTISGVNAADSVRAFNLESGAAAGTRIIGFTIRLMNCAAIWCVSNNNVLIQDCIFIDCINFARDRTAGLRFESSTGAVINRCMFRGNASGTAGGAVQIITNSEARIQNCLFEANRTLRFGGGICVTANSQADIFNCQIVNNTADVDGGGVAFTQTSRGTVRFCSIVGNTARAEQGMGGGCYVGQSSSVVLINSIFYNNAAPNGRSIYAQYDNNPRPTVSYCLVEGGTAQNAIMYFTVGQGNIDDNPGFVEGRPPIWGMNFLYLDPQSPCVDRGSDRAEALGVDTMFTNPNFILDRGVADMGCHYMLSSFRRVGVIRGWVMDAMTERGIGGARVVTSAFRNVFTDQRGYFNLAEHPIGRFWLRASAEGYLDSTIVDSLCEDSTMTFNIMLLHPEFNPSLREIVTNCAIDSSVEVTFDVRNTGNGTLEYTAETRLVGEADRQPWMLRRSFNAGTAVDDDRLQGVVLIDSIFYVSGANMGSTHQIYTFNMAGQPLDSFPQFSTTTYGINDMTYDPWEDVIWGADNDTLWAFTRGGDYIRDFRVSSIKNIAWDPDRQLLFVAGTTTNISAYDRDGNRSNYNVNRRNMRIYGMSYWFDIDGYCLYVLSRPNNTDNIIYKMNPETADTIRVANLTFDPGVNIQGMHICDNYDLYSIVFLTIGNVPRQNGGDQIFIYQFAANTAWMALSSRQGSLLPNEQQIFRLLLNPFGFPLGNHFGQIIFTHNALNSPYTIPIALTVRRPSAIESEKKLTPREFGIHSAHPNPFNAATTIIYDLQTTGDISLSVFDLAGREVSRLANDWQPAGRYTIQLNAADWPSGIYLIKLKSADRTAIRKIALIR
ncbi:MAG: T9SS type A sorting domain-containing protein [Calditrichaeota bacterium]|nr:T9SS type A sorting domain-containing protein [Calditrichota bacterium]